MNEETQGQNEHVSDDAPDKPTVVSVDGLSLSGALNFAEREGGLGQEIQNPLAREAEAAELDSDPGLDSLPPFDKIVATLLAAREIDEATAEDFLQGHIIPPERLPELMRKILLGEIPPS